MIRFSKIEVENFCSFKSQDIDLTSKGVILVMGDNRDDTQADSNGAGKSLIFETFCWGIWGETVRGISGEDLVNKFTKKNCRVSIFFEDKEHKYRVNRYYKYDRFKENDLELFINDVNCTKEVIKSTQAVITSIIGLDFESFCYLMPGSKVKVSNLTDKGFKELLENFTKLHLFDRAHDITKQQLKLLEKDITAAASNINYLNVVLEKDRTSLKKYEKQSSSFEEHRQQEIQKLEARLAELPEPYDMAMHTTLVGIHEHGLNNARRTLSKLNLDKADLCAKSGTTERKLNELLAQADFRSQQTHNKRKLLTSLVSQECPTCSQAVDPDHVANIDNTLCLELKKHEQDISKIQKVIDESKAQYTRDMEALKFYIKKEEEAAKDFWNMLDDLTTKKRESDHVEDKRTIYTKALNKEMNSENTYASLVEETKKDISKLESKLVVALEEQVQLRNKQEILEFWLESFSPKGLRSFILKQVTPFLNNRLLHYCNMLTNGSMLVGISTERTLRNGTTKDDFSISTVFKHGAQTYKGCSEGEKARVDLVLSLALADLVSKWIGVQVPIRFYDEAFEKVDHSGLSAIVSLLKKDCEKYDTIFVITHNKSFQEFFDQRLLVVKQNGESNIV